VCTDDFTLLCLRSIKTDKDAPKILSIGHEPYAPETIKPEVKKKKNGSLITPATPQLFDVHEFLR